jgi:hypothetical protein
MTENDEKADLALTVYAPDLDEPEEDSGAGPCATPTGSWPRPRRR